MPDRQQTVELWDLWFPSAAATGLPFARGRLDATDVLLVHAAPEVLDVDARTDRGDLIAQGRDLKATASRPIARLTRCGTAIKREDCWPTAEDIGRPVILPGGEVGILTSWWNAEDESSWRWQVEFSNRA
jgi:hypothetical protein